MMNCRSVRKKFNGVNHLMCNGRLSFAFRRTNGNQWEGIDNDIHFINECDVQYAWETFIKFLPATSSSTNVSIRLSVCPSVCHTFITMFPSSYHHDIFRSFYQWHNWCPCKRSGSKVKVTEVKTPLDRFRTVSPVWIHRWLWNDAERLK